MSEGASGSGSPAVGDGRDRGLLEGEEDDSALSMLWRDNLVLRSGENVLA